MTALVRPATAADMAAVAAIYNHYIAHTAITFDTEPKTADDWRAAFERDVVEGPYQFVIAESAGGNAAGAASGEQGGEVAGFAYTGKFHIRQAYWTSIFVSVYCAPEAVGQGLGSALYQRLFDDLAGSDFHKVYAGITQPNDASVALHERFGFVREGLFAQVGRKFDQWHDVAWYARPL